MPTITFDVPARPISEPVCDAMRIPSDATIDERIIGLVGWHGPRLRSPRGAAIDHLRAGCEKRERLAQRPKRAKNPGFAAKPSSIHRLLVNVPLP